MSTKEFYEEWTDDEIDEYLNQFGVLVLFKIHADVGEAELIVHGAITDTQAEQLKGFITLLFGGVVLSNALCGKINEFAEKWHNKHVLNKKARVVNYRGKR